MAAILAILFDLNGVLYRYDRDARIACLAKITGRSPDAVKAAIWDSGFEDSGDAGAMDARSICVALAIALAVSLMSLTGSRRRWWR